MKALKSIAVLALMTAGFNATAARLADSPARPVLPIHPIPHPVPNFVRVNPNPIPHPILNPIHQPSPNFVVAPPGGPVHIQPQPPRGPTPNWVRGPIGILRSK